MGALGSFTWRGWLNTLGSELLLKIIMIMPVMPLELPRELRLGVLFKLVAYRAAG